MRRGADRAVHRGKPLRIPACSAKGVARAVHGGNAYVSRHAMRKWADRAVHRWGGGTPTYPCLQCERGCQGGASGDAYISQHAMRKGLPGRCMGGRLHIPACNAKGAARAVRPRTVPPPPSRHALRKRTAKAAAPRSLRALGPQRGKHRLTAIWSRPAVPVLWRRQGSLGTMFTCDICGAVVSSKSDMKTHLRRDHLESEVICPFCKMTGINYDEMNFHIEAAHCEKNESEGGVERINAVQGRTSNRQAKKDNTEAEMGVKADLNKAGTSKELRRVSFSLTNATLGNKTFNTENLPELRTFSEREPKPSDVPGMSTSLNETLSDMPECPFCGKRERYGEDVEMHIKIEHANLLDPPIEGNGQHHYECPVCRLVCTNYQILQEHVDLHIEESSFAEGGDRERCSSDLKLAQQLQEEEDRQRKSEESRQEMEEFQKLKRQYGLDNSGGYKQQQLRNMEVEVGRGRMQPLEFHKRKAEMMESLAFGFDDGKTRTSGIIEALHRYYQNDLRDVRRVWLSVEVDHFHSSLGDKGWGCGYRNFQMLLSSLLRNEAYKDCLKGHSRTIVGIEERKNRTLCLLVFDPGCSSQEMQKLKQGVDGNGLKLLRRSVGSLKHRQYQTVSVDGILSPEEKIVSIHQQRNCLNGGRKRLLIDGIRNRSHSLSSLVRFLICNSIIRMY
uniref:Zinc finger-containing ubiquitin peptidase 1 n=1 Tax=Ornithorhynchus anatinus TaxID=9258 RepID=A0A6I8N7F5_ORNAN